MEWFSPQQIHLAMFEFCSGVLHFFDFSVSLNWISPRSGMDVKLDRTGAFIYLWQACLLLSATPPILVSLWSALKHIRMTLDYMQYVPLYDVCSKLMKAWIVLSRSSCSVR